MKICTITCQNADNHGARLQAFALATYLESLGHTCEVIDYCPDYMTFSTKLWYWPGLSLKMWAKLLLQWRQRRLAIRRHRQFDSFSSRYIPLTDRRYASLSELKADAPEADVFIAGSDQIWNTMFRNGNDAAYYLDFGSDRAKRISFAASFATRSLQSDSIDFVKRQLSRFDSISVREKSGVAILKSLAYDGRVVVDPVFLLGTDEWDRIACQLDEDERYILVYDFLKSKTVRQIAIRLAKIYGCRIYSVSPFRADYADRNFCCVSPEKYVGLIKQAQCVVSNSFHGAAFSLIYQRNFFVVRREDGLNDRMTELLDSLGLSSRLIDATAETPSLWADIDYESVNRILDSMIKESIEYLKECL